MVAFLSDGASVIVSYVACLIVGVARQRRRLGDDYEMEMNGSHVEK